MSADADTFEGYVRARSVALQRFAYLVTRNAEDARDCVQDALVGLYPRFDRVRASGGVDAYVYRSIVNASVSRWRRTKHAVSVADPEVFSSRGPDSPDHAERQADADEAWRLCADLPPLQRAAVVLRFYDDRSFAEIGHLLDCTEATARSHVHRALTRLRTRLLVGDTP